MSGEDVLVRLESVGVSYPGGNVAIEGITLDLRPGLIYGLVGVNGAGKSTLFKTMMGFVRPTQGSVSVAGGDVRTALRKSMISYVPQTEDVDWNFPVLVEDVVMMGRYGHMGFTRRPSAADRKAVDEALGRTGMTEFRRRRIGELSGGQKKRVFVARALAQGGRIVFLDEPFTGVDIGTEAALIDLFRSMAAEGRLILVSTHNLGSVPRFCDKVILINRTLVAQGPVETTFTEENIGRAFGGMLRHVKLGGPDLHEDSDGRGVTVLTDDERPVVFYGAPDTKKIVKSGEGG